MRFARIDSRESFAIETPIFIARQADSHEPLEFPIRANHAIRANRANRFARITPLRGRKTAQEKKTNSWERRFPGTFRTNVPLILPIFSVFSVGGGPKVPRNFVPGNFFFLF